MIRERWQRVSEKLYEAMHLDVEQRIHLLDEVGGTDSEMRREIETLLNAYDKAESSFLHTVDTNAPQMQASVLSIIGQRFGDYRIIEQVGEGGMGEVYRAVRDDEQYQQEVAIKLVRAGLNSELVIRRFKNERQILANLTHPNIARLLDGGISNHGVSFLVMELVDGQPIDRYCYDSNLSTERRLELFILVCSAVQFAHQRLIIHRDIKPGNILVTPEGVPKLLDFGIAKILDKETGIFEPTVTVLPALTPAYASPEQVRGKPITTASDVYSLGVVLYELLTGRHPYRTHDATPEEIACAVCETEPEKPSTAVCERPLELAHQDTERVRSDERLFKLSKRLRGDLDNIVLKALRKEPERRYASAEQFAADIWRHLENLPVIARGDTVRYRTAKFVARHKTGVSASALVVLVLLVAVIVTAAEARIAKRQAIFAQEQRARAERRFNDVRKLANSLMFEIHDSIADLPGTTKARELLVKRALEYLDSLARESTEPALQREVAAAYQRIGDVQGFNGMANLGDYTGASASYAKAIAILEPLTAASPGDAEAWAQLLRSYFEAAAAFENTGDFDTELRVMQKAQSLVSSFPAGAGNQQQYGMSGIYYYTGRALEKTGHFSEALDQYEKAAPLMESIASQPQASVIARWYFAGDQLFAARMLAALGRTREGLASAVKGIDTLQKLSEDNPTNASFREGLAARYILAVDVFVAAGHLDRALRLARLGKQIHQQLTSTDSSNGMAKMDLGWSDLSVAEVLLRQGKAAKAAPLISEALWIFQKENPTNKYWYAVEMGETYLDFGKVSAEFAERAASPSDKQRLWNEASGYYAKALNVRSSVPGQLDSNGHDLVGEIHRELARTTGALAQLQTAESMPTR